MENGIDKLQSYLDGIVSENNYKISQSESQKLTEQVRNSTVKEINSSKLNVSGRELEEGLKIVEEELGIKLFEEETEMIEDEIEEDITLGEIIQRRFF